MKKEILCHFLSLFCVIIWGTTFISTKILLESFHPVVILIYRLVITVILLFIIHPKLFKAISLIALNIWVLLPNKLPTP